MKPLHYYETKIAGKRKITVKVSLADECHNGNCDFSATCDIYEKKRNGEWECVGGGCDHETIIKHFPHLTEFCLLHLSNSKGQPMYPVENGIYLIKENLKEGADYLRISESVAMRLPADKDYFKYQLFALGIVSGWKQDADKAIKHLEELTGKTFEDYETPAHTLTLSDDERARIETLIGKGYYSPESIAKRAEDERNEKRRVERERLCKRLNDDVWKAEAERDIMLAVFDMFETTDNVIIYSHKNLVTFNWTEPKWATYNKRWTEEEVRKFEYEEEELLCRYGLAVNREYNY